MCWERASHYVFITGLRLLAIPSGKSWQTLLAVGGSDQRELHWSSAAAVVRRKYPRYYGPLFARNGCCVVCVGRGKC